MTTGTTIPRALDYLRKALQANPDFYKQDAVSSCNISLIFTKANLKKEALKFVKNALRIKPEYACAIELYDKLKES